MIMPKTPRLIMILYAFIFNTLPKVQRKIPYSRNKICQTAWQQICNKATRYLQDILFIRLRVIISPDGITVQEKKQHNYIRLLHTFRDSLAEYATA